MKYEIRDGWRVARLTSPAPDRQLPDCGTLEFIESRVPCSIHYDLVRAKLLDDPFSNIANARTAAWVSQADWVYETWFDMDEASLQADISELVFGCVDTFCDVFVNGEYLGSADNMFKPWRFEIPGRIRKSRNQLIVRLKGHSRVVSDKADENVERIGCDGMESWSRERTLVRRYQRSYNTDFLGAETALQGIGILRPVALEARSLPVIDSVVFAATRVDGDSSDIEIAVSLKGRAEGMKISCSLSLDGEVKYSFEKTVSGECEHIEAVIDKPKLWWPNQEGRQTLYTLRTALSDENGEVSSCERKVGIRSVELLLKGEKKARDFLFRVNGQAVYIRGANWIPLDMLNAGGSRSESEKLFRMCLNANINMLRLWGGGMEEEDWFYRRCDELGIMVWQEAHMHSHTYPEYDEAFVKTVGEETREMLLRLRSHPCFAIFSGGNEQQEGWDGWNWREMHDRFYGSRLIYGVLPRIAETCCPEIPYIPNSPFGEKNSQSPVDGDTHTWGNFINATEDPLFVTETCWYYGTLSRPETLEEVCGIKADDYTGLRWHRAFQALTGHVLYQVNQYSEYHKLSSLRDYLNGLEIEQLRADYTALFYLRTRSPSCRGIIYWPFNKGGPMMGYGCVDYRGRPLMPYYGLVRLYKNAVVHIYRDADDMCVVAANSASPINVRLTATHWTVDGKLLRSYTRDAALPRKEHIRLARLENWYENVCDRWREFVHVKLETDAGVVGEDIAYFCPFAEVEVEEQSLTAELKKTADGDYKLTLYAPAFSKLVQIEGNQKILCSDNYFPMLRETKREITISSLEDEEIPLRLRVQTLDCTEVTAVGVGIV